MKILKRILLAALVVIVLMVISAFFVLNQIKKAAIPDYNKSIGLPGLSAEVTVLRDSLGIPHIYAQNEKDLYHAIGFIMAQDRLWQMDLLRRVTQGRLSEILGKDLINADVLMRSLRIQEKSEKILASSSPEIVSSLNAFSEGINDYIRSFPLPPEFRVLRYKPEPWEPVFSINLIGYMSWDLTSGWDTEWMLNQLQGKVSASQILDLIPRSENHPTAVYRDFARPGLQVGETILSAGETIENLGARVFYGSNNWAVSGKKSKTGKPILANDMHLGLMSPGIWVQMHQHVEGKLNVTGLVLPGQPFVIAGHNDSIAWGMTNVMVDDLDFYAEKINKDSTQYLLDGVWKDLLVKTEIIKTKEGGTVVKKLRFTHRGPIVNDFRKGAEVPVSIHWLGNEMSNEIRSVFLLDRAQNWADFRNAARTFVSVSQNIVYADVSGNIGLQCSAGVPVRAGNGIQVYPGDSSKYDWQGLVPFEELPFEFNPERGYVSSANNKTAPDNYPHYVSHWYATSDRIDRIREMLNEKELLGKEDFKTMQRDVKSKQAEKFTPVFIAAIKSGPSLNAAEKEALGKLTDWNYELTRESVAASVYEILYRKVCENMLKDDLTPELFKTMKGQRTLLENFMLNILPEKTSEWIDDKTTPEKETYDAIVVRSFKETIAELTSERGQDTENWQWGKIHTFTVAHPLGVVPILDKILHFNKGPFGVPGSYHTVCPYSYSYNNLYKVNHGASHRHIFDTSDWDSSETVIPTGNSGIPASAFYLNQTDLYLNNTYHSDPFSKPEVVKTARFKMSLIPE
jgi:penicillin G amidase